MNRPPPRANCFDASALVKIYITEPGSELIRDYFNNRAPTKYTTPFCFYESMNIIKGKWIHNGKITKDDYIKATFDLCAWFSVNKTTAKDIDLQDPVNFSKVQKMVEDYSIDVSDAFQILSVKEGYFSHLMNDSQTILVTADKKLAEIARIEHVKSWDILNEPEPQ